MDEIESTEVTKHGNHNQKTHGNWAKKYARNLATLAHADQVDLIGVPYILHPLRVAERLADAPVEVYIAGLLHDTVEDTWLTLDTIKTKFGPEVARLVDAVTKRKGESNVDYYKRIKAAGPNAVLVKMADLDDNTDPDRAAQLPEDKRARLAIKYALAREVLTAA